MNEPKTYFVTMDAYMNLTLELYADSEEEAKEMAKEMKIRDFLEINEIHDLANMEVEEC